MRFRALRVLYITPGGLIAYNMSLEAALRTTLNKNIMDVRCSGARTLRGKPCFTTGMRRATQADSAAYTISGAIASPYKHTKERGGNKSPVKSAL
jgi:hypothetical protein